MPGSHSKANIELDKNKTPEFSYSFSNIDSKKVEKIVENHISTNNKPSGKINPKLSP